MTLAAQDTLVRGSYEPWDDDEIAVLALVALSDVDAARRLWRRIAPRSYRTLLDEPVAFDEATQRYATINDRSLRDLLLVAVANAERFAGRLAATLTNGTEEIDQWQAAMVDLLRSLALAYFALGRGGFERMTADDFAAVTETLEFQFTKLNAFASQIDAGLPPTRIVSRSKLYPQSTALLFHQARRTGHEQAGFTEERRVLTPAEHCSECPGLAALSWQPIGTLPDIGVDTPCIWNCRCFFEWR